MLRSSSDEFGTLADGFNGMAEHLQSMYKNLEAKVAEKTAELQDKTERLASLYEVTALVANATSLETLAQQFAQHVARIAHADGVALRWSSQGNLRHLMLAAHGLPLSMVGLMQYLTPTMQLLVGVLLFHEPFGTDRAWGFSLVWAGLAAIALEAWGRGRRVRSGPG